MNVDEVAHLVDLLLVNFAVIDILVKFVVGCYVMLIPTAHQL